MSPDGDATKIAKQIDYLARALKAPRIREAAQRLGDQARDAGWSHEEYLAAVLDREVSARDASGAHLRIRGAGFGTAKTIEESRQLLSHALARYREIAVDDLRPAPCL